MNTDLFLIRHGEPQLQKSLLGSTNSPLSKLGWQQLDNTFDQIESFDYLISSPLSRCSEFAKHFVEKHNLHSNLTINDDWKECHFGDWDGETYEDLHSHHPENIKTFFNDPYTNTPPNGESLCNFSERVELALQKLLKHHSGKQLAILTHAGVIRTLVAWCLKMDYRTGHQFKHFAIDYASVTHISIYQEENQLPFPQLVGLNRKNG